MTENLGGKKRGAAVQDGQQKRLKKRKVAANIAKRAAVSEGAEAAEEVVKHPKKHSKEKPSVGQKEPINSREDVLATFEESEGKLGGSQEMQNAASKLTVDRKKDKRTLAKRQAVEASGRVPMIPKGIVTASLAEQADALLENFTACTGATFLEKQGLEEAAMQQLSTVGTLEDRLAAIDGAWRAQLASSSAPEHGSPIVLFVSGSAAEANSLIKRMPYFHRGCKVAKCFAKHIKVEEQRKMLDSLAVNIAVGTPHRMAMLAELGCLKLRRLRLVVLDMKVDPKQRTLLDIPEVRGEWWRLFKKRIQPLAAAGSARLALMNSDSLDS